MRFGTYNFLCCIFALPPLTSSNQRSKSVNVALETVLQFDRENSVADLKLISDVEKVLNKVKSVIGKRAYGAENDFDLTRRNIKFSDFLQNAIHILHSYNDKDLKDVLSYVEDELNIPNLLNGQHSRRSHLVKSVKFTPTALLRRNLKLLLEKLRKRDLNERHQKLIKFVDFAYRNESEKLNMVLKDLKFYKQNSWRRNIDLRYLIMHAVKNMVFDSDIHNTLRSKIVGIFAENWAAFTQNASSEDEADISQNNEHKNIFKRLRKVTETTKLRSKVNGGDATTKYPSDFNIFLTVFTEKTPKLIDQREDVTEGSYLRTLWTEVAETNTMKNKKKRFKLNDNRFDKRKLEGSKHGKTKHKTTKNKHIKKYETNAISNLHSIKSKRVRHKQPSQPQRTDEEKSSSESISDVISSLDGDKSIDVKLKLKESRRRRDRTTTVVGSDGEDVASTNYRAVTKKEQKAKESQETIDESEFLKILSDDSSDNVETTTLKSTHKNHLKTHRRPQPSQKNKQTSRNNNIKDTVKDWRLPIKIPNSNSYNVARKSRSGSLNARKSNDKQKEATDSTHTAPSTTVSTTTRDNVTEFDNKRVDKDSDDSEDDNKQNNKEGDNKNNKIHSGDSEDDNKEETATIEMNANTEMKENNKTHTNDIVNKIDLKQRGNATNNTKNVTVNYYGTQPYRTRSPKKRFEVETNNDSIAIEPVSLFKTYKNENDSTKGTTEIYQNAVPFLRANDSIENIKDGNSIYILSNELSDGTETSKKIIEVTKKKTDSNFEIPMTTILTSNVTATIKEMAENSTQTTQISTTSATTTNKEATVTQQESTTPNITADVRRLMEEDDSSYEDSGDRNTGLYKERLAADMKLVLAPPTTTPVPFVDPFKDIDGAIGLS